MDEIPLYLLSRKRRESVQDENEPTGEKSEDGDFKQLAKIREDRNVKTFGEQTKKANINSEPKNNPKDEGDMSSPYSTEALKTRRVIPSGTNSPPAGEYRTGLRKLSTITESDITPVVDKTALPEAASGKSTGGFKIHPLLSEKPSKFDEYRSQLFQAVLEDDVTRLSNVVETAKKYVVISDLMDPNNGMMNALNFAIEHGKFASTKYFISIADEKLLLHQYIVPDFNTPRTALHQLTITNDFSPAEPSLARTILEKVRNKKEALTVETKFEVKGQRERTFPCLLLASLLGKEELVQLYLQAGLACGLDVNQKNSKNDTAILWAARSGHDSIVKYLLENDADPNIGNDKLSTALHWAVRYERKSTVETLVKFPKTDVNKMRSLGLYTPLIMASAYGFIDIVKVLIANKADVNFRAPGGTVALHIAVEEGHLDIVKLLIRNKADLSTEDDKGDRAIIIAARKGFSQIVLTLLHWKDDPYKKNHMGHDAWYYAIENEDDNVLRVLLDYYHLKPEVRTDSDGNVFQTKSPLFTAATTGKADKIKYILDSGIKTDLRDLEGNTFMHYAAINGQAEVIEKFYKHCDINAVNNKKETPLHCAVHLGKIGSIRALLKAKARTDLKTASNQNVLHLAARSTNTTPEIARELVAYTIQAHSWDTVNDVDGNKNNALHIAAKHANPDVLWEFRRVSFKMQNKKGCTPFHRAVRTGEPEILETMLDIFENMQRAGNINEQNLKGETVLHLAVLAGFHNTVKRLIYLRGDLEVKDLNGDTPLHRLVKLIVKNTNPESQRRCLDTLDAIIYECPRWFCYSSTFKGEGYSFNSEDVKLIQRYRRQGLTWLLHKITNNDNFSVFTLCFSVGAHEFLNKLLTLDTVKYFSQEGYHYNDISDITPLTNGSLAQKYFSMGTNKITPNICGLELLSSVHDTTRASKVLDIIPIRYLETIYGRLNLIIFSILIAIHLIYMFIFSFAGIEISRSFRNTSYTFSPSVLMTVAVYVVVPVEPIVLIIFSLVSFFSAICRRDFKKPVSSMLPYIFYLSYSFLVVTWLALVSVDDRLQDYILALCLCFGWLYTIVLTRGLKGIHYFWRMIKYMVIKDTLRFLVVYVCVLLAFSFSLHVVFQISSSISDTYPSVGETIFLTFTLMLGMGELFDDNFSQGMSDAGRNTVFAKVLFVVYVILAAIILLNMLIAMMNDSYRTVSEDQKISWRIDSIQLGVRTERLLPLTRHLFRSLGVDLMEIPGEDKGLKVKEKVVRKYFLKLRRGTVSKLFSTSHEVSDQKEKELLVIKEQITNLNIKMKSVGTEMSENSKKLDLLVDSMKRNIAKRRSKEK